MDYDVAIVGGGLVGTALACALADTPLRCALLEAQEPADLPPDQRHLSLNASSRHVLSELGVWDALRESRNAIERIHVSDQGHFGTVLLHAHDAGMQALAHTVSAQVLQRTLQARLRSAAKVSLLCPAKVEAVTALRDSGKPGNRSENQQGYLLRLADADPLRCKLLVVADGARSRLREQLGIGCSSHDYRQCLLIRPIRTELPHRHTAYERFTRRGPLAILPGAPRQAVLVFPVKTAQAPRFLRMPDTEFFRHVHEDFGHRLGTLEATGPARAWHVRSVIAERQTAGSAVLLGNAAHSMHPNAAQGLNLCLRDMATLARLLRQAALRQEPVNDPSVLRQYLAARKADQRRILCFNQQLGRLFYSSFLPKRVLRKKIICLLAHSRLAREQLIRLLSGLAGGALEQREHAPGTAG